jgi:hypothetical protein
MKSASVLFLITLLVVFIVQVNYFKISSFGDSDKWVQRAQNLSDDILTTPIRINLKDNNDNFRYGGHPGTTIILPAAFAYKLGADPQKSLTNTVAFLNAILIAAIATVCFKLRPQSPWYLTVAPFLAIHPLYFYGTPTNIVIAPTIALLSLLALSIYEHRNKPTLKPYMISFAAVAGFALATRLPITILIAAPLISFVSAYVKARKTLIIIFITVLTGFILNTFLWLIPGEFITTIILRTASHIAHIGTPGLVYTPSQFIYYSPIAFVAFLFISVLLFLPSYKPPVTRSFILTFLLITGTALAVFIGSSFKTLRYLYPIIFTWNVLFPLFLLHATKYFDFSFLHSQKKQTRALAITRLFIITFIILSFGYLTFYNLFFPGSQGLI